MKVAYLLFPRFWQWTKLTLTLGCTKPFTRKHVTVKFQVREIEQAKMLKYTITNNCYHFYIELEDIIQVKIAISHLFYLILNIFISVNSLHTKNAFIQI